MKKIDDIIFSLLQAVFGLIALALFIGFLVITAIIQFRIYTWREAGIFVLVMVAVLGGIGLLAWITDSLGGKKDK